MARKQLGTPPDESNESARLGDVVASDGSITAIVKMTQAAYDALTPKVATTLYIISS